MLSAKHPKLDFALLVIRLECEKATSQPELYLKGPLKLTEAAITSTCESQDTYSFINGNDPSVVHPYQVRKGHYVRTADRVQTPSGPKVRHLFLLTLCDI